MKIDTDWKYVAILLIVAFILTYYAIGQYDLVTDLDTDASGHIAKVYTLISQMKVDPNPLYWGVWDWNHFAGYDFLRIYPSFSYLIWATLSVLTSAAPEAIVKIWVFLTLPLGGLLTFLYLRRRENICRFISTLGALSYITLPVMLWYFVVRLGYVHVLLIFTLLPLLAYFLEMESVSMANFVALTLIWAIIALTHLVWFVNIAFFAMVFILTKYLWKRDGRHLKLSILSLMFALAISSFSTLPVLFNLANEASITMKNGVPYDPFMQVVTLVIFTNGMLILELAYSLLAVKKRRKNFYPYACVIIFASVLSVLPTTINDLVPIFGGSTLIAFLIFEPKIFARVVNSLRSNLRGLAEGCILIVLVISAIIPPIIARSAVPILDMQRFFGAWDFLRNDDGWFRVETFPHHAFGSNIPFYTSHSTLTYWYSQGAPAGMKRYLFLAGQTNEDFSRVINKTDSYVKFLEYSGVKYVVVDGYFDDVVHAFLNSSLLRLVYEDSYDVSHPVRVFIIDTEDGYNPITVARAIAPVSTIDEFYTRAIDDSAYNYSVVYVADSVGKMTHNSIPSVSNWQVFQEQYGVAVDFNVSAEGFVVLPFTYKPQKMPIEVFPSGGTQLYRAYPGFVGLYVPRAGCYRVYIHTRYSTVEALSYFASLTSLLVLIFCVGGKYIAKRFGHRLGSRKRDEKSKV